MTTQTTPARRPGGRSAAVMSSVKTAVEELIAERGRDRLTIPLIAERAGVQPSSVYRRWGDLSTMVNDIATYHLDPERPIAATGDVEGDLRGWAREIVEHYRNPVNAALLRGGAASADVAGRPRLRIGLVTVSIALQGVAVVLLWSGSYP